MDADVYLRMAAHEHVHWWFVGRRAVIAALLDRVRAGTSGRIVEAGCGTGGNLYLLSGFGEVVAFEPSETAVTLARARNPEVRIELGALPDHLPFERSAFDVVAALDVLEHVDDDDASLRALVSLAKPGGHILVTVPAHPWLWGSHDRRLHHRRRYTRERMRSIIDRAEVDVLVETSFNLVLALPALLIRLADRVFGIQIRDQEHLPPRPVNTLLAFGFSLERHLIRRRSIPIGLSLGYVLRRRHHTASPIDA